MLVGQHHLRVAAVPGQRRRHQRLAAGAEVAPVRLVRMIDDQPVGQPGVADRAGQVEHHVAAVPAVPVGLARHRHRVRAHQLRHLADHVDHAARVHDPVQQRGRPLQHLDAVGGGVQRAALHHRHAVAHDRAVAVVAEAALHDRVLRAGQRVALRDAADVGERVVEVARFLVAQHLGRHDVDGLRRVEHRLVRARDVRLALRPVAVGLHRLALDDDGGERGGRQRRRVGRGPLGMHQRVAAARLAHRAQAAARQQLVERLADLEAAMQPRAAQAGHLIGREREQDAGLVAEAVQRALQRAGRNLVAARRGDGCAGPGARAGARIGGRRDGRHQRRQQRGGREPADHAPWHQRGEIGRAARGENGGTARRPGGTGRLHDRRIGDEGKESGFPVPCHASEAKQLRFSRK